MILRFFNLRTVVKLIDKPARECYYICEPNANWRRVQLAKYMTAQRRKLIAFLEQHPDSEFSAKEIAEGIKDEAISISAVYRNLSELEGDGQVTSVLRDGTRDRYYRCLLSPACRASIHLTCTKCGKTFHLNELDTKNLIESTKSKDSFYISAGKSVLYGLCSDCI